MAKYRKKLVIIDVIQYNGLNKEDIDAFVGKQLKSDINSAAYDAGAGFPPILSIYIDTPEGVMEAKPNDFIIKSVNGEFYLCKPVFLKRHTNLSNKDGIYLIF